MNQNYFQFCKYIDIKFYLIIIVRDIIRDGFIKHVSIWQ